MNNGDDPAVPVMDEGEYGQHYGLSKREHYAGLAMQGIISSTSLGGTCTPEDCAVFALRFADALLKELDK